MCWNAEISLNTFIFGIISAIIVILLNKINYIIILFIFSVSLMQLLEYFAWKNIDNKENIYYLSIIGFLIILFQIIILNYGFLNNKDRQIALIIILIFSIQIFIYNYQNNKFNMEVGENKHLIWHWVDIPLPLLIIVLIFYIYPAFRNGYIPFLLITVSLLISFYYYYKYKTWGTMWCYFSNFIWLVLIGKSIYLKNT